MKRQNYAWRVSADGHLLDSGTRYAHNTALEAGTAVVRSVARREGQMYSRGETAKTATSTTVTWSGDVNGRELVVHVDRPS